ncbi:hypothetical protein EBV26_19955, partial [bacterium]|nr:hypothetical protein [bacterium]
NNHVARVEEYSHVFENFIDSIKDLPFVINNTALLVITGDIFHTKCKMETAGAKIFFDWINKLLDIVSIIVICGNHDYKQEEAFTTDSIDMFVTPYNSSNRKHSITYLNTTGIHKIGDIEFGLVSVKDTLKSYNSSGINNELPTFPKPTQRKSVALFHGSITQCYMPSGTKITNGYPLEWFEGYKMVLLGDIHKQQLNKTGDVLWGYPGSLIQQDFGESTNEHGYIVWDIDNITAEKYHVYNKYGAITIKNNKIVFNNSTEYEFNDIPTIKNFPKQPKVRVIGSYNHTETYVNKLKEYHIIPSYVKTKHNSVIKSADGTTLKDAVSEIANINSPEYWEKYLKNESKDIDVTDLIHNIDKFLITVKESLPKEIESVINTRNKTIEDLISNYKVTFEASKKNKTYKITLKYMTWDYLMCFTDDNYIDFEMLEDKSVFLNGANATGKSSFIDILCIAIFGEPSILRKDYSKTQLTAKVINDEVKDDEILASVQLFINIDSIDYEIHRSYMHHNIDINSIKTVDTTIYKYNKGFSIDEDDKDIIAEGNTMVDAWIKERFGTLEEFLMSTVLCQTDTTNFFYKSTAEQQEILDRALHMDTISAFEDLINASVLAHKFVKDKLKTYVEGMKSNIMQNTTSFSDVKNFQDQLSEITKKYNKLTQLKQEYISIVGKTEEISDFIDQNGNVEEELKKLEESFDETEYIT